LIALVSNYPNNICTSLQRQLGSANAVQRSGRQRIADLLDRYHPALRHVPNKGGAHPIEDDLHRFDDLRADAVTWDQGRFDAARFTSI
jgi:hypothetical protein